MPIINDDATAHEFTVRVLDVTHNPENPSLILAEDFDDVIEILRMELETISDGFYDEGKPKLCKVTLKYLGKLSSLGEDDLDGLKFLIPDGTEGGGVTITVNDVRKS